jgi:alkylated DNA repair dioxygenase AlkB
MDLFDYQAQRPANLLPCNGQVRYYGSIFNRADADAIFHQLQTETPWAPDQVHMHGQIINTRRNIAWYGARPYVYSYSRTQRTARAFTPLLTRLKAQVEQKTGEHFNACLLNLYHDGRVGMGWHSDSERELKHHGTIASLSFGAVRKFAFKHKHNQKNLSVELHHGSLLTMAGEIQSHWLHSLPPSQTIRAPRINLTFRTITDEHHKV